MSDQKNFNEKDQRSVGIGVVSTRPENPTSVPLPLKGKSILVTRTLEQASTFSDRLRTLGATPIEFPTIRIVPPSDWKSLDNALKKLCPADSVNQPDSTIYSRGDPLRSPWPQSSPSASLSSSSNYYDWLIFTSANGVSICIERMRHLGYPPSAISNVRIAAIGPATAAALAQHGILADLVPDEYIAEGIAAALIEDAASRGESLKGKQILLPRAAEARKVLVTELQQAGAIVDEVAAYRTLPAASNDEQGQNVLRMLQQHQIDIVTFTSSSTVRNFMQWLADCEHSTIGSLTNLVTRNSHLKIACIGPITSQTAHELGLDVHIEAKEFTIGGLVEAIVQHEEKS